MRRNAISKLALTLAPMALVGWHSPVQGQEAQSGDQQVVEKAADPAVTAVVDAAKNAVGLSSPVAAGVGVFLTPSKTAPPSMDECNGTNNCTKGFPSNTNPPPPPPPPPPPKG